MDIKPTIILCKYINMESLFFILPISVVKKIIENIHDDNTYRNFRISCKDVYGLMPEVKTFYENKVLKSSIKFFRGFPIGSYSVYTSDGYLLKSIPLSSYGIDGVVRFYENFKSYYRCNFVENKKNGIEVYSFSNGSPYIETPYRSNLINGKQTIYFKNGLIYAKKNYKNGLLHGECNFYNENGNIKYTIQFHNNMINGECICYYNNSTPFIVSNFKNNKLIGMYSVYYINGNLKMSYNIQDGKINGIVKTYHNNGRLKDLVKFINDRPNGIHKNWYKNGTLCIQCNYKNGILHGEKYFYDYENNFKRRIYHFKYLEGKLIKFTEISGGGYQQTISYIYDNYNIIGGKYSSFSNNIDIETEFDKNMKVNNFIHKMDMLNNTYYKYFKKQNSNSLFIKKFTESKFLYSITKIDTEYKVFDNIITDRPIKYFTNDLSQVFV